MTPSGERKITRRDAALAVDCPVCYSEPGQPCYSEDGQRLVPVHDSRVTDLNDAVSRARQLLIQDASPRA